MIGCVDLEHNQGTAHTLLGVTYGAAGEYSAQLATIGCCWMPPHQLESCMPGL